MASTATKRCAGIAAAGTLAVALLGMMLCAAAAAPNEPPAPAAKTGESDPVIASLERARALVEQGDLSGAERQLDDTVVLIKQSRGALPLRVGTRITLGRRYFELFSYEKARRHLDAALALLPTLRHASRRADALSLMGDLNLALGRYDVALDFLRRSVAELDSQEMVAEIRRKANANNVPTPSYSYVPGVGRIVTGTKRLFPSGERNPEYQYRMGMRRRDMATCFERMAMIHYSLGHPVQAEWLLGKASEAYATIGDLYGQGKACRLRARVQWALQDAGEAERLFQEALRLFGSLRKAQGEQLEAGQSRWTVQAFQFGPPGAAANPADVSKGILETRDRLARDVRFSRPPPVPLFGHDPVLRQVTTYRLRTGGDLFLVIFAHPLDPWHGEADVLGDLAQFETARGRLPRARRLLDNALRLHRAIGDDFGEASDWGAGAALALAARDFKSAAEAGRQQLARAEELDLIDLRWRAHHLIALAESGMGHHDAALAHVRTCVDAIESMRGRVVSPAFRLGREEERVKAYEDAIRIALDAGDPPEAFEFSERARARRFLDMLQWRRTTPGSPQKHSQLIQMETRLEALRQKLQWLRLQGAEQDVLEKTQTALSALDREYGTAVAAAAEGAAGSFASAAQVLDVAGVAKRTGEVPLLSIFVAQDRLYLFLIDGGGLVETKTVAVTREELRGAVRQFLALLSAEARAQGIPPLLEQVRRDRQRAAMRLWRLVMEPVWPRLDHREALCIAAHGVLHYVPFPALQDADGKFLVERLAVRHVPSGSALPLASRPAVPHDAHSFLLAAPATGPDTRPLPGASEEVRTIAQQFPDLTILTDAEVTRARLLAELPGASVFHFAGHAQPAAQSPLMSALHLAPSREGKPVLLTCQEILSLALPRTELCVLSACSTDVGDYSEGDEVDSLAMSFLSAGARSVLASLWPVDDRATASFMEQFYRNFLDRRSAATCLRRAQMAALAQGHPPHVWAAFKLTDIGR